MSFVENESLLMSTLQHATYSRIYTRGSAKKGTLFFDLKYRIVKSKISILRMGGELLNDIAAPLNKVNAYVISNAIPGYSSMHPLFITSD